MAATPNFTDLASQAALVDANGIVTSRIAWAFAPHEQSTPDMTVRLDAGSVFDGMTLTEVAAQSSATIAAPTSNPRIDRVVIDRTSGVCSLITGTESASPSAPDIPFGHLPVAQVLLETTSTEITNAMITDERNFFSFGNGQRTVDIVSAASYTYVAADQYRVKVRTNSGAAMSDTLSGALPDGWQVAIVNGDAGGILLLGVSGANLDGGTDPVYLGPGQSIQVVSDGTDYWSIAKPDRCRLGADTTLHIATTGDDGNGGLTSSDPWATMQHAWDMLQDRFDLAGHTVTIQLGNGTYSAGVKPNGILVGQHNSLSVIFQGDTTTPSNVVISVGPYNNCFQGSFSAQFTVSGMELIGSQLIHATHGSRVVFSDIIFGTGTTQIYAASNGSVIANSDYTISGDATYHWHALDSGEIFAPHRTITLSGTPNFSVFAVSQIVSHIHVNGVTFTGSATGTRYSVETNSVIYTASGSATYLPGSIAGTTSTGGQYV